jgi:phosphoserine phosphatase
MKTVCFDCDSTLSAIEGMDELARRAGILDEISPLTRAAMEGILPLDAVYGYRLQRLAPTAADIAWLGSQYIAHLVPDAKAVVASLQGAGITVRIVSGGLRQSILPMAKALGIPPFLVHAVEIYFDGEGAYLDFDRDSTLVRKHGKGEFCRLLGLGKDDVLVGDGYNDVEVRSHGLTMVGFGGVVHRDAVERLADHFIPNLSLAPLLPILSLPPLV